MQKRLLFIAVVAVCLPLAGFIGWSIGRAGPGRRNAQASEPVLGEAPAYRGLTNQLGQSVASTQFAGKVRVVTFLFPYCTSYCPLIAAHLVGFEHVLTAAGLADRVQIVAFDVDPAGTGPRQMRAFLAEYDWNPKDLHFQYLTGAPARIRHIVRGGYHVAYRKKRDSDDEQAVRRQQTPQLTVENPLARKADVAYDIIHNDGLEIVDTRGRIRKIYTQADTLSPRELLAAVRPLLGKSAS